MLSRRQLTRDELARARGDPVEALNNFFTAAEGFFRQLSQYSVDELNGIDFLERDLRRLEDVDNSLRLLLPDAIEEIATVIRAMIGIISGIRESIERLTRLQENNNPVVNPCQGPRGRPKLEISEDQLYFLRSFGFRWGQIQNIIGVSRSTLLRRRADIGLAGNENRYTDIEDDDLQQQIQIIMDANPNIGQRRMIGALRARGVFVQQRRVREQMRMMDPEGQHYAGMELFTVRINASLAQFAEGWNHHPMRTANNTSPYMQWIEGVIRLRDSDYTGIEGILSLEDVNNYGIDPEGPLADDDYQVVVPEINPHITNEQRERLRMLLSDATNEDGEFGTAIYTHLLQNLELLNCNS
eukprot:gene9551-10538_t